MSRLLILTMALAVSACTVPTYEAEPVSSAQWQRRQERIQRQETERLNRCETLKADPERYRACQRPGGATP